jgi:F-type H+-transporting ATPase subunit b
MLIDWFTVIAQVINFLVLVWLLKRFLYKPVLKAIAQREKGIADQVRDAAGKEAEAQKAKDEYRLLNEQFNREKEALLVAAVSEAAAERMRLLEEGRKESDQLRARLADNMEKDQNRLKGEFARRAGMEVFDITRKLLTDLADTTLETEMVRVFIRRLQELTEEQTRLWQSALHATTDAGLVRTAFDLSPADRQALEKAWNKKFAADRPLAFEQRPDLVSGIELAVDGYKLSWSISDYLASMKKNTPYGNTNGITG